MNEQDLVDCFAMMILNGMLSRLNPAEIEPDNVWYLAREMVKQRQVEEPVGLPAIKRRRKSA